MSAIGSLFQRLARRDDTGSIPTPPPSATLGPVDPVITGLVLALMAFGVVMVFSASAVYAADPRTFHDGHHFLTRQAVFATIGAVVMIVVSRIDYHRLRPLTYPAVVATLVLFVATMLFGRSAGGATRWIRLGPIDVQAAEVAKLTIVMFLAYSLSKKAEQMKTFKIGVLPHLIVMALFALFCLVQPDLGSAVMIGLVTFLMLFLAGARLGPILGTVLGLGLAAGLSIALSPWRRARVEAFLDPFAHREGSGYQIVESMLAFGSGGLSGVGIGDSRQKLFFLPEAHTDFISAIIGEELGFVGMVVIIGAFAILVARGLRVAWRAPDEYGTYLAAGATLLLGLSAFTNLAVAMGLLPTKGLVLPFLSYGGSSLVVDAAAIGVVLNVSRQCVSEERAARGPGQSKDGSANARTPRAIGVRTDESGKASRPAVAVRGAALSNG